MGTTRPTTNTTQSVDPNKSASATDQTAPNPDPTVGPQAGEQPERKISDSSKIQPGARTGYHCGHCGQNVGAEGQHYSEETGEQVETPHAGTLVVADNWAAERPSTAQEVRELSDGQLQSKAQNEPARTEETK